MADDETTPITYIPELDAETLKRRKEEAERETAQSLAALWKSLGPSEVDFVASMYQQEWQPSEKDIKLRELSERYHAECEAFDRIVCTGPIGPDGIMPATSGQLYRINEHAARVLKDLAMEAADDGISKAELLSEIRRRSRWRVGSD